MHKKKKVGSALTTLLVTLILGVILVIMFWKVLNRERPLGESEASEVKILLEKDIENDYPVTPREVIKLYLRFISCFYGEELERDEIEGLNGTEFPLTGHVGSHNPVASSPTMFSNGVRRTFSLEFRGNRF